MYHAVYWLCRRNTPVCWRSNSNTTSPIQPWPPAPFQVAQSPSSTPDTSVVCIPPRLYRSYSFFINSVCVRL
ncbi:hypothetical protein B0H12DRAFT_1145036, partial [Mycena haematopus]